MSVSGTQPAASGTLSPAPAPSKGSVGMFCLILAETAFFAVLLVAYVYYIGKSLSGPRPVDVLEPPLLATAALLTSSVTLTLAVRALRSGNGTLFLGGWITTVGLGAAFLAATAGEWHRLIHEESLTISTNLFGSTYYTLVGAHAAHVTLGTLLLAAVAVAALRGAVTANRDSERLELLSWYWHFVDAVWVVVFTTVYVVGL
jgi:cytochrome c oxidase subunit 3